MKLKPAVLMKFLRAVLMRRIIKLPLGFCEKSINLGKRVFSNYRERIRIEGDIFC